MFKLKSRQMLLMDSPTSIPADSTRFLPRILRIEALGFPEA